MATTLPEIMDAIDGLAERLQSVADRQAALGERFAELVDLTVAIHGKVHDIHRELMDSGQ